MQNELIYQIALVHIPGVGGVTAKRLISSCGGAEQVFREKMQALKKIPGIGEHIARSVRNHNLLNRAEQEISFLQKHRIRALFYLDKEYPHRLRQCEDGPVLLYVRGNICLNHPRVVAIVGTRSMTPYGREQCEQLVHDMAVLEPLIVSGLAYGVDGCAHQAALNNHLLTAAVLGHGMDRIYPPMHHKLARKILDTGALVTDFMSGTRPDRDNFPKRNRIIAGLCDAIVVVEAAVTGGALITANIANTYNRDVFALPGKVTDKYSQGCNKLIRIHKAHLLETVADLQYIMNWEPGEKLAGRQTALFVSLTDEEQQMANFLRDHPGTGIDQIVGSTGFNLSKTSSLLLNLELKGVVKPLPGKKFILRHKDQ